MPSKSNSVGGSTYLPSDLFSPTWLLDGLDGHKSYEMRTKAKVQYLTFEIENLAIQPPSIFYRKKSKTGKKEFWK